MRMYWLYIRKIDLPGVISIYSTMMHVSVKRGLGSSYLYKYENIWKRRTRIGKIYLPGIVKYFENYATNILTVQFDIY